MNCKVTIALLTLIWLPATPALAAAGTTAAGEPAVTLVVQASPGSALQSTLVIRSAALSRGIAEGVALPSDREPVTDVYLKADGTLYAVDASLRLFDAAHRTAVVLRGERERRMLRSCVNELRAAHYGQLTDWENARTLIKMKSIVTVTDVETGLQFRAQRRAGRSHADVQPLTREDTAIMKRIYRGRWSWKRRAVIVNADGRSIAASMHGMPHGGDGIPGNDFRGHFCIHLRGSVTHGSGLTDPDHQVMVHKAAGKLQELADGAGPADIAQLLMIAINQQDEAVMTSLFPHRRHAALARMRAESADIVAIRGEAVYDAKQPELLAVEVPLRAVIFRAGKRKEQRVLLLRLEREAPWQPWKIGGVELS